MRTTSSVVGKIGRRTALALAGGIAILAAAMTIATAAVAGGGPATPAPSKTSSTAATSPPTAGKPNPGTAPGEDMAEDGWDDEDDSMEMGDG